MEKRKIETPLVVEQILKLSSFAVLSWFWSNCDSFGGCENQEFDGKHLKIQNFSDSEV